MIYPSGPYIVLGGPLRQPIRMLLFAMDQFAHVIIFFFFSFLSFLDDDIETISLSEVSRNGSNDFPEPQEVSLYDSKLFTMIKT